MSYDFKKVSEVFTRDSTYPMYSLGELLAHTTPTAAVRYLWIFSRENNILGE